MGVCTWLSTATFILYNWFVWYLAKSKSGVFMFLGRQFNNEINYFLFFPKLMNPLIPKRMKTKNRHLNLMNSLVIFRFIIKGNKNYLFTLNLFMVAWKSRKNKTSYSNGKANHQIIWTRKYGSCCSLPCSCE